MYRDWGGVCSDTILLPFLNAELLRPVGLQYGTCSGMGMGICHARVIGHCTCHWARRMPVSHMCDSCHMWHIRCTTVGTRAKAMPTNNIQSNAVLTQVLAILRPQFRGVTPHQQRMASGFATAWGRVLQVVPLAFCPSQVLHGVCWCIFSAMKSCCGGGGLAVSCDSVAPEQQHGQGCSRGSLRRVVPHALHCIAMPDGCALCF